MSSHVPLIYPTWSTGDPLPSPLVTAIETGRLGIDVYSAAGGASYLGFVPYVLAAETEEGINEYGLARITVPAADGGLLTMSREIQLVREGEGSIFPRAIIMSRRNEIRDDQHVLVIEAASVLCELDFDNLYRGFILQEETAADAFEEIVPAGWTDTLTGSGYLDVTRRWDNASRLQAVNDFAAMQAAYARETATLREIEVKNTHTATGMRLINTEYVTPALADNEQIGLVSSVTKTEEGPIFNRIIPFAKADGDTLFDLQQSDRSSPYDRLQSTPNEVKLVDYNMVVDTSLSGTGDHFAASSSAKVNCTGAARFLVALFAMQSTSSTGRPARVTANGKRMSGPLLQPGTAHTIMIWTLPNPDVGENAISAQYDVNGPPASGVWTFLAFDNIQFQDYAGDEGTGTSVSTQVNSNADDLIFDLLVHASATATVGAGQTQLTPTTAVTAAGLERLARVSWRQAGEANESMDWTLGSSVAWLHYVSSISRKPVYYIEDSTSQATHGVRIKPLPLGEFRVIGADTLEASANAMYDKAADYLTKHKDPVTHYTCEVLYLPQGPREWFPGDSFALDYVEPIAGLSINETLICTRRRASYDGDGTRKWTLTLSTVAKHREDTAEKFAQVAERLATVQSAQV